MTSPLLTLIHARHNIAPRRLVEPGPTDAQVRALFEAAAAAPDHQQIVPWRFVVVPATRRGDLGEAYAQALLERDFAASADDLDAARDKAHRSPWLVLAVARLEAPGSADQPRVDDTERYVSLGCAIQNMLLAAESMGLGSGLVSGQAMDSAPLRALFALESHERAVCFISVGTVASRKPPRERPALERFVSSL